MSCSVAIRQLDGAAVVELSGKFTVADSADSIWRAVSDVLSTGQRRLLMDLSHVTYLDSAAGIGELVRSYLSAHRQGAEMKLIRVGKNIDRVLRIVGLHNVFEMYPDEETAIRSFTVAGMARA